MKQNRREDVQVEAQQHPDLHRLLIEAVRDYAIFALDANGHVLTWNPGAERFKGYKAEEIIGRHFSTFYPEEDVRAGKPDMELVVARREGRFEDEGWRVRKDGTQFWANVVITALRDETGEVFGFGKVTRDLTERHAAHQQAIENARRIAEVEASNRAKSQFLAAMSHELRTPLNAISGYVELLEQGLRGPVNERQLEDLGRIRKSGQHLLGIINDLLNFSRLEAGTVSYDIVDFPVSEALDAVRLMIEPLAAAKSTQVEWPDTPDAVRARADTSKVEQILLNLITNAVKFTPTGGRIEISLPAGDEVRIAVSDNGMGIPGDQLESIFEPFVQVGRTLSSHHEGAGLGLAISRDLARAMGGELTAASEAGEGAVLTLTLPAAK
ncbi:MAG TPA: ATP-binding protein [Longimicrobiales bacterium]|nr:ATP-binding protein [Longimicrobiales bacterium]